MGLLAIKSAARKPMEKPDRQAPNGPVSGAPLATSEPRGEATQTDRVAEVRPSSEIPDPTRAGLVKWEKGEPFIHFCQVCGAWGSFGYNVDRWRQEVSRWPEALQDEWEERAAIIQFDGGEPRPVAEHHAYKIVRQAHHAEAIMSGKEAV